MVPNQKDFRPTEQRRLTRAKMIEATIVLLVRDGFARTSWRRVAEEAGVTGGVLQYHFGDKATLLAAVVEHLCEEHARSLREATGSAAGGSIRERVEAYVEAAFELMSGPQEIALIELLVGMRNDDAPPVSSPALDVMRKTHDDLWRQLFHDVGITRARLVAAEHLLFAALHGFEVQRLFEPRLELGEERAALIDAMTCLVGGQDSPQAE
ncbi:MAG: TetR/AcrR family transcriptional regulator [Deltaproteobacteria bacterium]|jgi:AcrR family transcriptional regulator|nr:TetR/AcrR family transcriptional regulator [Deltaproteobacteria bacterium]